MKKVIIFILLLLVILIVFFINKNEKENSTDDSLASNHLYVTWDTMEYDKCVTIWLIKRFYDKEAQFVFCPANTEITEGIVFDVPGAKWSRQHRKCTSDCILEELETKDPVVAKIVEMAHNVELNFWQLDAFPDAQKSFQEVMAISDGWKEKEQFIKEIIRYFDQIYFSMKKI